MAERHGVKRKGDPARAALWPSERIEKVLLEGRAPQFRALEAWLPPEEIEELRELARRAVEGRRRGGPRVYLLPGIMGSSLGLPRAGGDPDVLWLDFFATLRGRLMRLSLKSGDPAATSVGIRGILWRYYAKLQYRLEARGYDVVVHDFDWRLGIREMGRKLRERILADAAEEVLLVCHSMGGLVGRAALRLGAGTRVRRLVMLGTPNHGAFAPIQALRGTHQIVKLAALLDLPDSKEELVRRVFGTFPGLYEMIPEAAAAGVDYFDPANWPAAGLRPDPDLLARSAGIQDHLALPGDPVPLHLVAGVDRETTVAAVLEDGRFVYTASNAGDGTVPLALARLDGADTYYVEEDHGALPNNARVAEAVMDIFGSGATGALPRTWTPPVRVTRHLDERELARELERAAPEARRPAAPLDRGALEALIRPFLAVESKRQIAPAPPAAVSLDRVVVARRGQRRLDVELAHGDLTAVPSRCYVIGLYQRVDPLGAAAAVDAYTDDFIARIVRQRMFTGRRGEIFVLPCGRRELRCDFVLLAGLGPYDHFDGETQALVAENVVTTLVGAGIDEFCCVLLGDSSVRSRRETLRNMLHGFLRGLDAVDVRHDFRRITICERDDDRVAELRRALLEEAATALFESVQVTFSESRFPIPAPAQRRTPAAPAAAPHVYLLVRLLEEDGEAEVQATVMGARSRAAIGLTRKRVALRRLKETLAPVLSDGATPARVRKLGRTLPGLMFSGELIEALAAEQGPGTHLVLIHDAGASKVPWETLTLGDWRPALAGGMSRRYLAADLSTARWKPAPAPGDGLRMLLVVDPTEDLPGAAEEGRRIQRILGNNHRMDITLVRGGAATRARLREELASGRYDLVHYAGHGGFDPGDRTRCGLVCAGGEWLTGQDAAAARTLPPLIFFNACESARVRRKGDGETGGAFVGLAEALMRGGAANFVGTYWPVGDRSAEIFARTFYGDILAGAPLGTALARSRQELSDRRQTDWGDYIHFGDPEFQLIAPGG